MADRRGTHDKHVTVPDAVTVGARSDIATVTVTGSDCTVFLLPFFEHGHTM